MELRFGMILCSLSFDDVVVVVTICVENLYLHFAADDIVISSAVVDASKLWRAYTIALSSSSSLSPPPVSSSSSLWW